MKVTHFGSAIAIVGMIGGIAMAAPWFADSFDSYATQAEMDAVWSTQFPFYYSGSLDGAGNLLSPPNTWKMKKTPFVVRNWRSLIPAIQAINPSKNAVNGTAANPLIVSFQIDLLTAGRQEKTLLWLELVGHDLLSNQESLLSAPVKNPGTYGIPAGVCGPANTCIDGYYGVIGDGCARDSDCDAPMWLDFVPNPPTFICTLLDQSLPLPRPALAMGVYGGTNGLVPKGVPGDACAGLTTRGIASMVAYDGARWARLSSTAPLGSSSNEVRAVPLTTDVTLTIRETDFDITVVQAVQCGYDGRCDNTATCVEVPAGTCVNSVCTTNQTTCVTDADCNFCSDDPATACTTSADCRSNLCVGGPKEGTACTLTAECADVVTTCLGGPDDGAACTVASGTPPQPSLTCARSTVTKAHIPRQYTGPFQGIAIGPGRPFEGLGSPAAWGSDYPANIDTISISGGELLSVATGSCCLADGTCVEDIAQSACTQMTGAEYNGNGTTCATARCALGACCTSQDCVIDKTEAECEDAPPAGLGGVFQGINSTCENRLCCPEPFADADWDGDVDQNDFGAFQVCYTGMGGGVPAGCECTDRDGNSTIDGVDFAAFESCFTGANVQWTQSLTPSCNP